MTNQELLDAAYHAYNAREMEAALKTMHPEVEWPNTMEGGYVSGHEGIRAYWSKQWNLVDSHVEAVHSEIDSNGRIVLDVHQVVYDLQGKLLEDVMVKHIYQFQDGLIRRMNMGEDRLIATGNEKASAGNT